MNENGASDISGEDKKATPVAYIRSSVVGSTVSFGSLVALFSLLCTVSGFLLAAYRDTQSQLQSNFVSYSAENQAQHTKFWEELRSLEFAFCSRFPTWRGCK